MSRTKVAVIGVGYLGEFHAQKYYKSQSADLIGIVDTNEQRCSKISKKINVNTYHNFKDIINYVDAVSIVVPTNLHFKIAKYFIQNKKHVLIEKPFTSNLKEARALKKLSEENNVILQIGHLERFNKAYTKLSEQIKRPMFIECNRISPFKIRGTEVDVIMDLMIHDLDIIISLNNSKIKSIQSNGINVLTNSIDIAHARILFDNGCVCNLSSSRISDKVERKMRVFQKNEYYSLDYQNSILDSYKKVKKDSMLSIEKYQEKFSGNDSLKEEIESFLHCINNEKRPIVNADDGINALQYALKISKIIKK